MIRQAGLWIDHRKAVIVFITGGEQEIRQIPSNIAKRITGGRSTEDFQAEDIRDRQYELHLKSYYDKVLAVVRDAGPIVILGPGEAKVEFKKHMEQEGLKANILAVETADKMTDRQIAAVIRKRLSD